MLTIEVGPVDVAHTRYAISPLGEAMNALRVAAGKQPAGLLRPWAERVAPQYARLLRETPAVGALTTLFRRGGYNADFIQPPPPGPVADFAVELAAVRATPVRQVRAEIARNLVGLRWLDRPAPLRDVPAADPWTFTLEGAGTRTLTAREAAFGDAASRGPGRPAGPGSRSASASCPVTTTGSRSVTRPPAATPVPRTGPTRPPTSRSAPYGGHGQPGPSWTVQLTCRAVHAPLGERTRNQWSPSLPMATMVRFEGLSCRWPMKDPALHSRTVQGVHALLTCGC